MADIQELAVQAKNLYQNLEAERDALTIKLGAMNKALDSLKPFIAAIPTLEQAGLVSGKRRGGRRKKDAQEEPEAEQCLLDHHWVEERPGSDMWRCKKCGAQKSFNPEMES